ncbi:hypothetical protein [Frankia gtarii]|uniref:hypothetical protein n=1 Tax=Frankia gtarii TaxID=2950102 RepID=UPI0021BFBCA6|nr:hypothetical protein [Frankia gtarii]
MAKSEILRPRLYRAFLMSSFSVLLFLSILPFLLPLDEVGGWGQRIAGGAIGLIIFYFVLRIARLKIVIKENCVILHQLARTRKISMSNVSSVDVLDSGEILPWRIPVVTMDGGRELRLDEFRSLRRFPESIAERTSRVLIDAKEKFGSE